MKFEDYKYIRTDMKALKEMLLVQQEVLRTAPTYDAFKTAFEACMSVFASVDTMQALASVRYTINTLDTFYAQENDFWDESSPLIQEQRICVAQLVLDSPYVEELKKDVPRTYFMLAHDGIRSFTPSIIADLQEENRLVSRYKKLIASAEITFDNQTYTLASLGAKMQDKDRDVRRRSMLAYWGWMSDHEDEIDTIFDLLVHIRDKMAKALGFKNYIELGYVIRHRFDYTQEDVSAYRKNVLEDVVPLAQRLYEQQRTRLGYDTLECYDENFEFESGNPTPMHDKDEMVSRAATMYRELSKETGEFFDYMVSHNLLDLEAKPGKAGGGYCTCLPDYKSPFIFSNFNKTSGDVDVLTHEAGHAFQVYSSMNIRPVECIWPTYESAEIHSMSMEFFAWPWMRQFFGDDANKYYYLHLGGTVKFIPYGILVDHFQHAVYENVDMSAAQRKETWRALEKQYKPSKNYETCEFLEKGTWWFRQAHIFEAPFYYIDYTLAQVCALQFWERLNRKDDTAFKDYYEICKVGGTLTFKQIVDLANLTSPFEKGCLKNVMKSVDQCLLNMDDTSM